MTMDRMQRASLVSVAVVVLLALGLGLKSFGARLEAPFHLTPARPAPHEETEAEKLLRLKATDTDKDGLNDYEELYVYKTSPYLPDSDSDTYSDRDEIVSGHDPNCPTDKTCTVGIAAPLAGTEITTAPAPLAQNPFDITDPAQIRAMIASTGTMTKEQLAQIDDATLLATWAQVKGSLGKNNAAARAANPVPATTPAPAASLPANPTPDEIRKLLERSGATPEMLRSVDDATLLRLYQDARREQAAAGEKKQ